MQYDKVRNFTDEEINEKIEKDIIRNLVYYKLNPDKIENRLEELEKEWGVERTFERNASVIGFAGLFLSIFRKRWIIIPAVVTGFLFQHATQGWCPPISLLRRLGLRTRKEIDTEKNSLKLIRGDFEAMNPEDNPEVTLDRIKENETIGISRPERRERVSRRVKNPM